MCVEKKGGRPTLTPYSPCRRPVECPRTASNSGQHGHKCETYQLSYRCSGVTPPPPLQPYLFHTNIHSKHAQFAQNGAYFPQNTLRTHLKRPENSLRTPSELPQNSLKTPPELLWTASAHPQNTPETPPNYITNPHKSITYIPLLNIYKPVWSSEMSIDSIKTQCLKNLSERSQKSLRRNYNSLNI